MLARRGAGLEPASHHPHVPAAVVGDDEADPRGRPAQREPGMTGVGVTDDVEQGLARDLHERVLGGARQRLLAAVRAQSHLEAGPRDDILDELGQRPAQVDVAVAGQLEDDRPDLVDRRAGQGLGRGHALEHRRSGGVVASAPLQVHADREQVLGDRVVQLPCDPVALLAEELAPARLLQAPAHAL